MKNEPHKNGTGGRKAIASLVFVALFAAVIAASAFLAIPIGPVPVALANMFTLLSGLVLGPVLGAAAVVLYVAAGVVGVPIFSGGSSGLAVILGPSGGYIFGYILSALVAGFIVGPPAHGFPTPLWKIIVAVLLGLPAVYLPGLLRLRQVLDLDWGRTFVLGFLPFVPGDVAKGIVAAIVAPRLRRTAAGLLSR